ncbi:shikimate 5-dehydrogenase [Dongia mobilis]|uniref:Shikimate 5-dehydrogenase n=1 Tax=Dongia mobilis TaxID=578943 RepID=A0A4R6WU21_9PROT|nr:shikimate dehydrogenase [Dongia mobilis]TDQ83879.1 shikimate 5-dehydrogenase [Dongia mobilis]
MAYQPATHPTLYFIGVTTTSSSIMKVFPAWAAHLGLANAVLNGIDFPIHADPAAYREAVDFIKRDPLSLGALVTTHKIDLFAAARDLFDEIDPYAQLMGETSCISKRGDRLIAHAKDPISSGLAIESFLPADHFARMGAEVFAIGAGGSTIAITWYLMQAGRGANRPRRIIVADPDAHRLAEIRRIHGTIGSDIAVDYVASSGDANDRILAELRPGSLVINATGLGKDRPGSPLSDAAVFPEGAIAWDLNYRGDLVFLRQAAAQQGRGVTPVDGWTYFLHGWTQVIGEVFAVEIPTTGKEFDALSDIAIQAAKG